MSAISGSRSLGAMETRQGRLRIAQVAPLWMRVPPHDYGGAELMVHWLTEELVDRGCDVTLFASADSNSSARLHPVCDKPLVEAMRSGEAYQYEGYAVSALAQALARAQEFDIIHSHIGPIGIALGEIAPTPVIHTVHAGLDSIDEHWLLYRHPESIVVAISDSQVATVSQERRRSIHTIYHGLDTSGYPLSRRHDGYVLFLGRMGKHKNPAGAIRIARSAGFPIVLVGAPQDGAEKRYFKKQVEPLLEEDGVTYVGAVSEHEKVELLRGAAALVFPIEWDEHFGLVMIESMACGTPVIALKRGSVPEVIEQGVTGYFGTSEQELVAALRRVNEFDREVIGRRVRERFSVQRMTDGYLDMYARCLEKA